MAVDQTGVLAGKTVIAASAGAYHSLVLCSDGTLAAWGTNDNGQLGNGSKVTSTVPVRVTSTGALAGKTVVAISASTWGSTALCSDGTVCQWGDGAGLTPTAVSPVGALAGKTVVAIASGFERTLALCSDGTVAAWGEGLLGNGVNTPFYTSTPVAVDTTGVLKGKTVTAIAAGISHNLALCSDGTLTAWGYNADSQVGAIGGPVTIAGELGNDSRAPYSMVPVVVSTRQAGSSAPGPLYHRRTTFIAAGQDFSEALCSDGTLAAWGNSTENRFGNNYRLPYGYAPVAVGMPGALAGRTPVTLSCSSQSSAVLCSDGNIVTWGTGIFGVLGNGSTKDTTAPVLVSTASLATGERFASATSGPDSVHVIATVAVIPAKTEPATLITSTTATLNGLLNPNGGSLLVSFDYGTSTAYGFNVQTTVPVTGSLGSPSSMAITGLAPGTTYHFRVNGSPVTHLISGTPVGGTPINGSDLTFTTLPAVATGPASQLVEAGGPVTLEVAAPGDSLTWQWYRNNAALPHATSGGYHLAAATTAQAGTYTVKVGNAVGHVTSAPASLGVVDTAPASVAVVSGSTLTLTATAAGPGISFQWFKNGLALSDGPNPLNAVSTIAGATTSRLSITHTIAADAGGYTCGVTMPDPQHAGSPLTLSSGLFTVSITLKPVLGTFTPGPWIVGGTVSDTVPSQSTPAVFTLTGAPAGVTIDSYGRLHGKPTVAIAVATTYHLVITCRNAAGFSSVTAIVVVNPLPAGVAGTFNGLVNRDDAVTGGHGGTLSVTSLSNAVFTGRLVLGTVSYSFTAQHLDTAMGANPSATVVIPGTTLFNSLTLRFTIDPATGSLTGAVSRSAAAPVSLTAWRNSWNATSARCPYAAVYNNELVLDPALAGTASKPANIIYPQGTGFGVLSLTTAGLATWSGHMADGTTTTASTTVGPHGEVPLHFLLYAGTGSAHGWVQASGSGAALLLDSAGTFDWLKNPQTGSTLSYKGGFPLHNLTVAGAPYVKPTSAKPLVLGIPVVSSGPNTSLDFSEGGLIALTYAGPPSVSIAGAAGFSNLIDNANVRITGTAAANSVAPPAPNPASIKVVVNAATGAFSGSFTLHGDQDPTKAAPSLVINRTASFSGLCITRLNGTPAVNSGPGYFLLSELQPYKGAVITAAPVLSGKVVLRQAQ